MVQFPPASQLRTSDGRAPRTFEVAEEDGMYYPTQATISGNKIILRIPSTVSVPRFVRYARQPYTRANLVGKTGLPVSTFKLRIDGVGN